MLVSNITFLSRNFLVKQLLSQVNSDQKTFGKKKTRSIKGSLQKKKPEIYWSFTKRVSPPPIARIGKFPFFPRLFSQGGGHKWEKNFIHFLHVSEHIDHF